MPEQLQLVDKDNNPIEKTATRQEAWANGWYHRVVRVLLRDENGRVLLQKRSTTKSSYPGVWTDSASGHVDKGESDDDSVNREMFEEIGVKTGLTHVGTYLMQNSVGDRDVRTFNALYTGTISSTTAITVEEGEVSEVKWVKLDELKADITAHPENYTPGLMQSIERYF